MAVAIVRKVFEDLNNRSQTTNNQQRMDKFALKAFNCLSHNWKVGDPLIASFLLGFPNHYSATAPVKTINIAILKIKFQLIVSSQDFNQSDDIVRVDDNQ